MHPRLSVSAICTLNQPLDEDLAFWEAEGITRVGLTMRKLDAAGRALSAQRIRDSGLHVTNVLALSPFHLDRPAEWPRQREALLAAVVAAATVRADCLVTTTGTAGRLPWEDAADALAEALAPVLEAAHRARVPLVLEHTHALRADIGFLHTLRDAIDLARRLDVGVCLEVQACWAERGLGDTIAAGVDRIRLVQVSDFRIGTLATPDRVAVGDGDLPLARIVEELTGAGYSGSFDLELIGPRIEAEGYAEPIRRSLAAMTRLLED